MQALYLKWRPMTFEDVVGQEHVTYTLRNALISDRVGHAYLFSGLRGTGKTTTARLLAKAVNCLAADPGIRPCNECQYCIAVNEGRFLDLIEIDAASHTSVDDVRDLRDRIAFAPNEGDYKVYIIDEVHRFSGAAFDALLKTIEEPPDHAIFILATTEIHKVPQTILSRCQRFDFKRIPLHAIVERLRLIVDQEGMQAEDAALELIARQATGSMRDSISLLDQLIVDEAQVITLDLAQAVLGTVSGEAVQHLTDAIILGDTANGLDQINYVLDEGADARQFAREMVEYLRMVMLVQTAGVELVDTIASREVLAVAERQANEFPRRALVASLRAFNESAHDSKSGWQPQLPLELAFIESVESLHASEPVVVAAAPGHQQAVKSQQQTSAPEQQDETAPEDQPDPPAADMPSVQEFHQNWNRLLAITKNVDMTAAALLNSIDSYDVEGSRLVLFVPSDLIRDKIESDENRAAIQQALQRIFNQSIRIQCRVGSAQTDNRSDQVQSLLAEDDLVRYAVNELGGEVSNIEDEE